MIDISALQKAYRSGDIEYIGHVLSQLYIAEAFTKRTKSIVLQDLIDKGKILRNINLWIVYQDPAEM